MKRIIFDLDGTLLHGNFYDEKVLFQAALGSDGEKFLVHFKEYLDEYERIYPRYEIGLLSYFLSSKSNMKIDSNLIEEWIYINSRMEDRIDEGTFELLEDAKMKNMRISLLTNFFSKCQVKRIQNSNIISYFDTIICGDRCLKPSRESYI